MQPSESPTLGQSSLQAVHYIIVTALPNGSSLREERFGLVILRVSEFSGEDLEGPLLCSVGNTRQRLLVCQPTTKWSWLQGYNLRGPPHTVPPESSSACTAGAKVFKVSLWGPFQTPSMTQAQRHDL